MGIFDRLNNWQDNLTSEDIDKMEAQGIDVSELRPKVEAKEAEARANLEELGRTDLSKLEPYAETPRSTDTEFFKDVVGKPFFFAKRKIYEAYKNAELIYPMVVQASPLLYEPGDLPSAMIVLIWSDSKDVDYEEVETLRDLLLAMRDGEVEIPKQLKKIVKGLNNPKADVSGKFNPKEIDDRFTDAGINLITVYQSQEKLPNKMIPTNEILPCLKPEGDKLALEVIPGKWYVA